MESYEKKKPLLRRYLDGIYTTEEAHRLMAELQKTECDADMLQEQATDVWEEASTQQPQTDFEREQYKK